MTTEKSDWQTPEELAAELRRPVRWVKEAMASGELPSIKVRGFRYFTPECRVELARRQLASETDASGWGRQTRGRRSA